jgi:hypothetical protein
MLSDFEKHVFARLDNLEAEMTELREVTWPVCQGILEKNGPFDKMREKRRFFKFMNIHDIWTLIKLKARYQQNSRASAVEEYRQIQGVAPPLGDEAV